MFAGLPDPYRPTPDRENRRRRLLLALAGGMRALDPAGRGLTANAIVHQLSVSVERDDPARLDAADALAELMERPTAVGLGKILDAEQDRNLGGVRIVEAAARDRRNTARWVVQDVPSPASPPLPRTVSEQPVQESPASPANGGTMERSLAGDAGGGNAFRTEHAESAPTVPLRAVGESNTPAKHPPPP